MALPLNVFADLQLTIDGESLSINGDGDRLVVDVPRLRTARRLLTTGPLAVGDTERNAERVAEALRLAGITLEVRVQGDTVARIGADASPNAIGALLDAGPVEVNAGQMVWSVARRHPVATAAGGAAVLALIAVLLRRLGSDA